MPRNRAAGTFALLAALAPNLPAQGRPVTHADQANERANG
jgi:hypothetical protein